MNVQCPNCGVEASIPDEFADSLAEYACGECGSSYIEEEVHSEEPSPEVPDKAKQTKTLLWMVAMMFLLFGGITLGISAQNSGTRKATSQPPDEMTLAELVEKGPGENLYVDLSNLQFGEQYVYNEATGKVWTDAWAFLFAKGDKSTPLAIGQLTEGGEKQMMKSMEKSTLRGLVSRKPKVFKATVGKKLYKSQPGVESGDAFYIIREVNKSPSGSGINFSLFTGISLLGISVLFIVLATTRKSR